MRNKSAKSLLDLFWNIFLPAILMTWLDEWTGCSPICALGVALMLPLGLGLKEFFERRRCNLISAIGLLDVLLTGGIGFLQLPKDWIAVKESFVPAILGLLVLLTLKTSRPFFQIIMEQHFIFNERIIEQASSDESSKVSWDRLMRRGTWLLFLPFLLSAILNFILARYFICSETGTAAFNKEMGRFLVLGHTFIILPCFLMLLMTFIHVAKEICRITGSSLSDLFDDGDSPRAAPEEGK
ncbi:MAG: hypothetical protein LBT57_01375 [Puniceicoccales bacterium]|jgi:hypothetical protein|nr:hypothetical protein [Puniceicoccales bacterium]